MMLWQAGSFSKITSIASGQRVRRRGVAPGAGIKTPGGRSGRCERSASSARFSVSPEMLCGPCDMGTFILFSCELVMLSSTLVSSVWQGVMLVKGNVLVVLPDRAVIAADQERR